MSALLPVSRAVFLRMCGAVVLGRGLDPLSAFSMDTAVRTLAASVPLPFLAHIGTMAYAVAGDRRVPLRLAAVSDVRASGAFEQFSLTFEGANDAALPEGIYTIRHEALEPLEVFIAPVGQARREGVAYEACFSRRAAGDHRG